MHQQIRRQKGACCVVGSKEEATHQAGPDGKERHHVEHDVHQTAVEQRRRDNPVVLSINNGTKIKKQRRWSAHTKLVRRRVTYL